MSSSKQSQHEALTNFKPNEFFNELNSYFGDQMNKILDNFEREIRKINILEEEQVKKGMANIRKKSTSSLNKNMDTLEIYSRENFFNFEDLGLDQKNKKSSKNPVTTQVVEDEVKKCYEIRQEYLRNIFVGELKERQQNLLDAYDSDKERRMQKELLDKRVKQIDDMKKYLGTAEERANEIEQFIDSLVDHQVTEIKDSSQSPTKL